MEKKHAEIENSWHKLDGKLIKVSFCDQRRQFNSSTFKRRRLCSLFYRLLLFLISQTINAYSSIFARVCLSMPNRLSPTVFHSVVIRLLFFNLKRPFYFFRAFSSFICDNSVNRFIRLRKKTQNGSIIFDWLSWHYGKAFTKLIE